MPEEKNSLDAGTGFMNYQWNTGATTQQVYVTEIGSYYIEAKNNNSCISRDSFSLIMHFAKILGKNVLRIRF